MRSGTKKWRMTIRQNGKSHPPQQIFELKPFDRQLARPVEFLFYLSPGTLANVSIKIDRRLR